MTLREKIAGQLRQHVSGYYVAPPNKGHWEGVADAILALFEDTIKDAELWRQAIRIKHEQAQRAERKTAFDTLPDDFETGDY